MRRAATAIVLMIALRAYAQSNYSIVANGFHGTGSTISVNTGSGWLGPFYTDINNAVNQWDTSCGPTAGGGFPLLQSNSHTGTQVTVNFIDAPGPTCGVSTFGSSGTIINIYASAGGYSCAPYSDPLAHELGHVLGLIDPPYADSCLGSIMGARAPGTTRTISAADCAAADSAWTTSSEMPPPPPPPAPGPDQCGETGCGDGGSWNPDPLVLDLDGDGVVTTGNDALVSFDIDGDGTPDRVSWISRTDGFLWINLNNKNIVDDGSELLGIGTVLPDGTKAHDGFEALAMYDKPEQGGNSDGVIDASDGVWNHLRIWVDANHNGICEPNEVNPIHKFGIAGILLQAAVSDAVDSAGNHHSLRGLYWRYDGKHKTYFDIDSIGFQRALN